VPEGPSGKSIGRNLHLHASRAWTDVNTYTEPARQRVAPPD
jgi:hypothetical protein